jgi:signal transduction histidine kinase
MKSILIVDDIADNLYFLEVLLKANGFEVRSAGNGAEALQSARDSPPDLILTDILMPVMDGFTLCREWRADEHLKQIPFIFFTATYVEKKDEELGLGLGADRFIIKPQEPETLVAIIREVLDSRSSESQSSAGPIRSEEKLLRGYNEALFRKLVKKMGDLELAHQQEKQASMRLQRLNDELEERIRLRTNELEAKVAELDAFTFVVSHDLHAPMRQISSYSRILIERLDSKLEADEVQILQRIAMISASATEMVEALLELLRLGKADVSLNEVDLSDMTTDILNELSAAEPERRHLFDVAPGIRVRADRQLMRTMLTNLLENAWKYCAHRQETRISLTTMPGDDGTIFCIRDNGAGFDMQYGDKLFMPFQRLHHHNEFDGLGVGLVKVNRIVRLHGGRIWAESEPDKGASFYFTIPTTKWSGESET